MSINPKVSVIIPNYNHAVYLIDRLESVINQTYQDFEIILLDDASTDNSLEIIEIYRNCPLISKIIINDSNSGSPFIQWKKGIDNSKGNLLWIAESDDCSDPNFLFKSVEVLESNKEISLVFSATLPLLTNKNQFYYRKPSKFSGKYHAINDRFLYNWYFNDDNFRLLNASACLFRKDMINNEILKEATEYNIAGDKFFWLQYLYHNPVFFYLSQDLNYQRFHEATTRANKTIKAEYWRSSEHFRIYDTYMKYGLHIDKKALKEIGHKLFEKQVYGIALGKMPNICQLIKGIYWTRFDLRFFKKVLQKVLIQKK